MKPVMPQTNLKMAEIGACQYGPKLIKFFFVIFMIAAALPLRSEADESLLEIERNWTGDFDQMAERHPSAPWCPTAKRFISWTVPTSVD